MIPQAADRARRLLLVLSVPIFIQAQAADSSGVVENRDTTSIPNAKVSILAPLFHNPPVAILNDRPFRMDVFVNFEPEEIERVALLFRTDSARNFKEVPLEGEYYRYQYIIPKEELQDGDALTYYFLLTLKDYRLFVLPQDSLDQPDPFVIDLVPPTKEFFQRRLYE